MQYSIINDTIYFDKYYKLEVSSVIRQFDCMSAYSIKNTTYLIVLDNDETVDSNYKYSTLKVFILGD